MQAMILAAGFGTRLLPYTKLRPKPLFPLLNEPLLLLTIRHLQAAGFDHIFVNCHYLKEQIVAALAGLSGVVVQEEDIVLGTGGGLRKALSGLRNEPVLITNGDIYHTVDYLDLYRAHTSSDAVVTMAMHDYSRFNNVTVQDSLVTGFDGQEQGESMAFTGLHVLDPKVLTAIPEGVASSIIDRYRELLLEGRRIQALRVDGCSWTDMGTVDDYLALHGKLLKGEIPLWHEFPDIPENSFLVDKQLNSGSAELREWACIGRAQTAEEVVVERCVVWNDAILERGKVFRDVLLV